MSKTCPSCKREVDESLTFCNFCGAFAGNPSVKEATEKVITPKNIIAVALALLLLAGIMLAVFVFDIFGLKPEAEEELIGRGKPLFSMGLTPVALNGKWGYADKNGKMVISPAYGIALPFADKVNGLALVSDSREGNVPLFGYINEKGEYKISPTITDAESFSPSGYARVYESNFIDGAGRMLLGKEYSFVSDFTESGYALAIEYGFDKTENRYYRKDGYYQSNYYIVDKSGRELYSFSDKKGTGVAEVYDEHFVLFRYKSDREYEMLSEKEFALASYKTGAKITGYYDRIYKSNGFYILCRYDEESYLYKADIYDNELNMVKDGYYTDSSFVAYDSGFVLYKKEGTRFVRTLITDSFDEICAESADVRIISGFDKSGIACVKEDNRYVGYSGEGKVFQSEYPFGKMNCGLAPFLSRDGRIGYINVKGETVLGADYIAVSEFSADGYATVFSDGSYKIIDTTGKVVIDKLFDTLNSVYKNGLGLSWYGNNSFDRGIKLMFNGGLFTGASSGFSDNKNNAFGREKEYRLYNKNGELLSDEKDIIASCSIDGYGGVLAAQLEKNKKEYEYKLIYNSGKTDAFDKVPLPAADENGIICSGLFRENSESVYLYGFAKKNGVDEIDVHNLLKSDKDYYLIVCEDYYAELLDKNMRVLAVVPYSRYADITGGKLIFNTTSQTTEKWVNAESKEMDMAFPTDNIYDYYTGRRVLRNSAGISITENGFIEGYNGEFYSPDGRLLYRNNDTTGRLTIVDDSYPDVLLFKNGMDDTYMFIDRFGNRSEKYEFASGFGADGYATVRKSDGKYYCIDTYFNELFSSDNQFMGFNNGLAAFYDEKSGFIGYMDISGNVVIEPEYHAVSDFSYDGYAVARDEYGNAFIIDVNGDILINTDGFEGSESVKYINDNELGLYSRYSYENGYKYYLTLDWETEKNKLFRYGLTGISGKGDANGTFSLVDVYGNVVFGPYYMMTGNIEKLPDGTPCFMENGVITGLDGKPVEYLKDYRYTYIIDEKRIYADGMVLTEKGEPLPLTEQGYECINTDFYGYLLLEYKGDNEDVQEYICIDKDNNPAAIDDYYNVVGNDLIAYWSDGYYLGGTRILQSISTGEVLLQLENAGYGNSYWQIAGGKEMSVIVVCEDEIYTIYSYSKEKGLELLMEDVAQLFPERDKYVFHLEKERLIEEARLIYFGIDRRLPDDRISNGNYGMLVCNIEKGTVDFVENFYPTGEEMKYGRIFWRGEKISIANGRYTCVLDDNYKEHRFNSVMEMSFYSDEYINGFKIGSDVGTGLPYYKREDGKVIDGYRACSPFFSDGFAIVNKKESSYDYIIDRSGNIIY